MGSRLIRRCEVDTIILTVQAWMVSGLALIDAAFILRRLVQPHQTRRQTDRLNSDWLLLSLRMLAALVVALAYGAALLRYVPFQLAAELIQSGLVLILTFSLLREMRE